MTEAPTAAGAEVRSARRAAGAYVAALNARDPDVIAACVTHDFINEHASAAGRGLIGREAYRTRLPDFLAEFGDLHYHAESLIVDGDQVAIPYLMRATWLGSPPSRHPVALRGLFRLRVRDGLIAERTDYWDSADFLRQTGQR